MWQFFNIHDDIFVTEALKQTKDNLQHNENGTE